MLKIQFSSECNDLDRKHPVVNGLTVLFSLLGLAAASLYFIIFLYSPGTVLPIL